jgi:hypothetical protein
MSNQDPDPMLSGPFCCMCLHRTRYPRPQRSANIALRRRNYFLHTGEHYPEALGQEKYPTSGGEVCSAGAVWVASLVAIVPVTGHSVAYQETLIGIRPSTFPQRSSPTGVCYSSRMVSDGHSESPMSIGSEIVEEAARPESFRVSIKRLQA